MGEILFTVTANWNIINSCEGQLCLRAVEVGGTTLTLEPVSTKKRVCVCKFLKNKKR